MDSDQVLIDGYGCKCDSETVIFCFDKRTGECKWSCSGHCFERLPSQAVATQTENTSQSFPTLQQKTSSTKATETESNNVSVTEEPGFLMSNAIDARTEEVQGQQSDESSATTSVRVSHGSPDQVVDCVSDDAKSVPDAEKSKASKKIFVSCETSDEIQNVSGDEVQRQSSFGDLDHDKDKTVDNGNESGDARDGTSDEDTGSDNDINATHLDSVEDDSIDDEGDADTSLHSVDIPNPPLKVKITKKSRKPKTKAKVPREVFPCTYCTRKCTTKIIYEKHIEWHTRSKETKCSICGKEFTKPGYLINHQKQHQQAKDNEETTNEGTDTVGKENRLAECRYCGKLMKAKVINGHEKNHTQPRQKRNIDCSYCGKNFTSLKEFLRHERTHTKERPYPCNQCEKAFCSNQELAIHIRRHLGDKRYKCDHCGKAFVRKCNLDEHLRTHTGARPFKCNYCDKAFGFKNVLKVHLVRHTGIRPHTCVYCDKGFAKKAFLDKHVTSHHE